jgi:hypothetical protein
VAKAAAAAHHAAETRRASEAQDALKKTPPAYVPTQAPEPPREIVDRNAKLKAELAELSHKAQDRQRLADASRESLTVAEAALQKSEAELEALERRLEQILSAKRRMAASLTKVSSEGIAVESQLARTKARLRTLHGQIAQNSTIYTFVAYDGVTGTTRRPILIECTREHIKFLQEDVSLSSTDVSGYSLSYNPVLAGAQALLDYWTTHSGPDDPRPYVLLIVRPSGAVAYGAARHLLERMKDPFGYELLPDDQQLDVPPAVPEAAEVCRKAVEKAMSQRVDVFKEVFGNGTAPGGGRLASGKGGDGTRGAGVSTNGSGKSPFDDLGDPLLGGSGRGGQQIASGTSGGGIPGQLGGTGRQPGVDGTNSTANSGLTDGGPAGSGAALNGAAGSPNSGAVASDSTRIGNAASGNAASGNATSGNATSGNATSGNATSGNATSGNATSGNAASGSQGTGSGESTNRAGGGVVSDARPGVLSGMPGGQGNAPMPGPGNQGLATAAGTMQQANGGTGGGDQAGANSRGSFLSQGDGVGGGSPGTLATGSAAPRIGTPTSAMLPGNPSARSLGAGGEESGLSSAGAAAEPNQGELPPPIMPSSPAGTAAITGTDNIAVGHATPGSSPTETTGETSAARAGQSGLDSGLAGTAGSVGTAQGATPSSASGGIGSGGTATADGQATEPSSSQPSSSGQPGSSGQPQSEGGGMPSFGSPSAGASDGEEGPSGPSSDAPSNARAAEGASGIGTNADENDAPRRNNGQQAVRRWGISSPRASIGFEHDLAVYIESGRIYVGHQPPIACGRRETSDQLTVAVLRAVDREARTWGRPRENFYWVPNLRIVVCAGGIVQYERLQPAIARHGLSSSVEFRLEQSRPAPLPRLVTD